MLLADTSVWIDHLRNGNARLKQALERTEILGHPFIVGELALGSLNPQSPIIALLANIPQAISASNEEVMLFIAQHSLSGLGIGFIDVHLLAATALTPDAKLFTLDRRLHEAAERLGLAA